MTDAADRDADRDAMALIRARLENDYDAAGAIIDNADLPALALVLTDIVAGVFTGLHGSQARAAQVVAMAQREAIAVMEAEDS